MESVKIQHGSSVRIDEARFNEGINLGETIAGAGAIVLSILGLVGIVPVVFLAIATLVIGGVFLMASGSIVTPSDGSRF
jgi:hypothetical protein